MVHDQSLLTLVFEPLCSKVYLAYSSPNSVMWEIFLKCSQCHQYSFAHSCWNLWQLCLSSQYPLLKSPSLFIKVPIINLFVWVIIYFLVSIFLSYTSHKHPHELHLREMNIPWNNILKIRGVTEHKHNVFDSISINKHHSQGNWPKKTFSWGLTFSFWGLDHHGMECDGRHACMVL